MAKGKKRGGRLIILLALVLIIIVAAAGILMRDRIFSMFAPQAEVLQPVVVEPTPVMYDIVVVIQSVGRGSIITDDVIGSVSYPQDQMVEGLFITDKAEVLGKRAKYDLEPGTPLTPSLLSEGAIGSFAAFQIPAGMVAISIPIDQLSSVSYALQPGDHVNVIASVELIDIDPNFQTILPNLTTSVVSPGPDSYTQCGEACIATGTDLALNIEAAAEGAVQGRAELDAAYQQSVYVVPSEDQRPRLVTQTIVQDVTILGVGNFAEETETTTPETTSTDGQPAPEEEVAATEEPKDPEVITLVVTPQDATAIDYMIRTGIELTLVMRGAGDEYVESTQPVTLQFIMDQYNIPYPSKLSYSQYQRLDQSASSTQLYDEFGNPIPQ